MKSAHRMRCAACWFAAVLMLAYPAAVVACEGSDLEKTVQIIRELQAEGARIGFTCASGADVLGCVLRELQEVTKHYQPRIEALAPSCQQLIASVGGGGGGGATRCVGSICCDASGCYGP